MGFIKKSIFCIVLLSSVAYIHIEKQNEVTELRLLIPQKQKELKEMLAENERLTYEIETFLSPVHLMELSQKPEFTHLKYPMTIEVIQIEVEE